MNSIKIFLGKASSPANGKWFDLGNAQDTYYVKGLMSRNEEYIISDITTDLRIYDGDLHYTDLIKLQDFINKYPDRYTDIVAVSYSVDIHTLDKFIEDCDNSNIFFPDDNSMASITTQFVFDKIENGELGNELQKLQQTEYNYAIDYDALWRNLEITNNITLVSLPEHLGGRNCIVEIF